MKALGRKNWVIPDCELPPAGEGALKGHESVIVVNETAGEAVIRVSLYFTDAPAKEGIEWRVAPRSVRCFRMNERADMSGYDVPLETQYAMRLTSSRKVVVQYGRLDNRQVNLAYYTTLGYGG